MRWPAFFEYSSQSQRSNSPLRVDPDAECLQVCVEVDDEIVPGGRSSFV